MYNNDILVRIFQKKRNILKYSNIFRNIFISSCLTLFVYSFYSVEFVRSNIEDKAFDLINEFYLSEKEEKIKGLNFLLFTFDESYLKEQKLLDENDTIRFGYLLPRIYIAKFIEKLDAYIKEEIENENDYPHSLFIDFDMSYSSDLHNKKLTYDDEYLLNVLKIDRPYTIYLAKTSNYNFIESSSDSIIQEKIANKKIVFSSVALSVSVDDISRRYYPYRKFLKEGKELLYPLVDIDIFNSYKNKKINLEKEFSQEKMAFIENRIIFKDYSSSSNNTSLLEPLKKQSYWKNFTSYSANYNFYEIYYEDFYKSIIYLGSTHKASNDVFTKDTFDREISGIEMHSNALMTLFYLDGKLNRLPLFLSLLIISCMIFLSEIFVFFSEKDIKY